MKISEVEIPTLLFEEGVSPANPGAGFQRLFVASADSELTLRDSGGSEVKFAPQVGTTKGDLYVYNGSTLTRLAVGADDQVLTADSAEASGVKWAAGGGGGGDLTEVATETLASDGTITLSSIPTTGKDLILVGSVRDAAASSAATTAPWLRVGATSVDTGSNYHFATHEARIGGDFDGTLLYDFGSSASHLACARSIVADNAPSGWFAAVTITILNYADTSQIRPVLTEVGYAFKAADDFRRGAGWGQWNNTADAIDVVQILGGSGGNLKAGSTVTAYVRG